MINTPELRNEERIQQGMTREKMSEKGILYPQAQAAEKSLLASYLMKPGLICERIKPDYIYNSRYRIVLNALLEMRGQQKHIDTITVSDYLKGKIDEPDLLIADLVQTDSSYSDNVTGYSEIILENYKARKLIDLGNELIEAGLKRKPVSDYEQRLSEVLKIGNSNQWTPEGTVPDWILSEPEPFKFVIPGLLASGVVGFIYGSGGTYKSLAALWLILQRATMKIDASQKWFDKFEPTFGKSIFFSAEDVQLDLHHRVFNIVSAMKDNRPDVPKQAFIDAIFENCRILPREKWIEDGEPFIIDENGPTNKVNRVIDLINSFGADLAILETRSRIANIDGNDNSAGARLLAVLERIRDETGATILVIDHSSKVTRGAKTDLQGQNSLIGAGVKLDNGRFGLLIEAQKRNNGSDILKITNSKGFRCKRADSFKVKVDYPKFSLVEESEVKKDIYDTILEIVKDNPGIKREALVTMLPGSGDTRSKAIKWCKDENLIINEGKGYFYVENQW